MAAKKQEPVEKKKTTLEDLEKYVVGRVGHNVVEAGNSDKSRNSKFYSTGVFMLDFALTGGIKDHTCITYVGKPGSGKTTTAYRTIGAFQKRFNGINGLKKRCLYINLEKAYDPVWAAMNGVDTSELLVATPSIAEEAVDIACAAYENDDIVLVVFDSIPSLVTEAEFDKSAEDAVAPGAVAKPAARMMRKIATLTSLAYHQNDPKVFIMINQWRAGIGSAPHMPRTMPGGTFVYHSASSVVEFYKTEEKTGHDANGVMVSLYNTHTIKTSSKQRGNSVKEAEFILSRSDAYGLPAGTIDDYHSVVQYAQMMKLAGGAGTNWWLIDPLTGEVLKYGSKKAIVEFVSEQPEIYEALKRATLSAYRKTQGHTSDGWW